VVTELFGQAGKQRQLRVRQRESGAGDPGRADRLRFRDSFGDEDRWLNGFVGERLIDAARAGTSHLSSSLKLEVVFTVVSSESWCEAVLSWPA
jgi:hypothetical protein